MTTRFVALCVDANEPLDLARFWAEALRWEIDEEASDQIALAPTDGTTFGIVFRPVSEIKMGRNRIHFDLTTTSIDDQRESVARLVGLGARHIDIGQRPDEPHVVLADPEGNELCVLEPEAILPGAFLAGCGRLGALSCGGSREVGLFWSAAFGWPLVWDQDGETAIRERKDAGAFITWGGPPIAPKIRKNRLHLHVAPCDQHDQRDEIESLISVGATEIDIGQGKVDWVVMDDPDGNEFCVLKPH